MTGSDGWL